MRQTSLIQRFLKKVNKTKTCWIWTGARNQNQYGVIGRDGKNQYAHRTSYEIFKGDIPSGLSLDHLCRNPSCVNPNHLEAVTHKENVHRGIAPPAINKRKHSCKHGHVLAGSNLRIRKMKNGDTKRTCIACVNIRNSRRVYS